MLIKEWDHKGVNFSQHLYVPEVHPLTGVGFCEMEDGHVFKVSACKFVFVGSCLATKVNLPGERKSVYVCVCVCACVRAYACFMYVHVYVCTCMCSCLATTVRQFTG